MSFSILFGLIFTATLGSFNHVNAQSFESLPSSTGRTLGHPFRPEPRYYANSSSVSLGIMNSVDLNSPALVPLGWFPIDSLSSHGSQPSMGVSCAGLSNNNVNANKIRVSDCPQKALRCMTGSDCGFATSTSSALITSFPAGTQVSQTLLPHPSSISYVTISGLTAAFTPTQVPWEASLTTILTITIAHASGNPYGMIIFPSAGGLGWIFPCDLDACATPFPSPPLEPPLAAWISANAELEEASASSAMASSTMTTLPPGFSTAISTNSLWTDNTWVTTEG
jgi:hypothetical protein